MSILASLSRAYDRLAKDNKVPTYGFSTQSIHACIILNADGTLAGPPALWDKDSFGKKSARMMQVPYSGGRSGQRPPPYFLWDNTAYVLGVTAKDFDPNDRHNEFKKLHIKNLHDTTDEGLRAVYKFLASWEPEKFYESGFNDELKDKNIVFRLGSKHEFVHESSTAKTLWESIYPSDNVGEGICLVSGLKAPIARLHPPIGSFENPARIVSFNEDAYDSYGHSRGENAPVSEAVAFNYSAALNYFLEKGSSNKIQIGDASTIFWADALDAEVAQEAEALFPAFFSEIDEAAEAKYHIKPILEKIHQGQPLNNVAPKLSKGVRFYVLGLAPNAARLSIRFWLEDDFGNLAESYQSFLSDMRIEPPDRDANIALWKYLRETAVLGKGENVPPNLAGEWMRSILTGTNYPMTLLATVLMRIRADHDISARRISMLKAVLTRNFNSKEAPVAFDPDNRNKGYLLGRLFAVYEHVQAAALGRNVNATIKDKFYGSASAQPRKVFAILDKGSANHLSKVGKQKPGYKVFLEKQIGEIMSSMSPSEDPFPSSLSNEQQALFGLGYYHQHNEFFKSKSTNATPSEENDQ